MLELLTWQCYRVQVSASKIREVAPVPGSGPRVTFIERPSRGQAIDQNPKWAYSDASLGGRVGTWDRNPQHQSLGNMTSIRKPIFI